MSECGFSKQILYFPTTHLPQRSLRTLGFLSIFDKNLFATLASLAVSIQDVISETALEGRANSSQAPAILAAPSMYLPVRKKTFSIFYYRW
jgi:hypothetical protein